MNVDIRGMGVFKKIFKADDFAETPAAKAPAVVAPEKSKAIAPRAREDKTFLKGALLHPVITEKSSILQAQNQYVFAVDHKANKLVIARAVENVYGIKPVAVRVSWVQGKIRVRGRRHGKTPNWKKAIVTLPQGKTITVAEGV